MKIKKGDYIRFWYHNDDGPEMVTLIRKVLKVLDGDYIVTVACEKITVEDSELIIDEGAQ